MVQKAKHSLLLDELSTVQIRDLLAGGWETVVVPLGATEQHGPALPLLVDNEHGVQTALRAARILGKTLVGPVVTLGYSPEHSKFPGTISLAKSTLAGIPTISRRATHARDSAWSTFGSPTAEIMRCSRRFCLHLRRNG